MYMSQKKLKNSSEAANEFAQDIRNTNALVSNAAKSISDYVKKKGGLENVPKVWSFVSTMNSQTLSASIIDFLLENKSEWKRLSPEFKHKEINSEVLEKLSPHALYKHTLSNSFWCHFLTEIRMGVYESNFKKIDSKTGVIIEAPQTFKFPLVSNRIQDKNDLNNFQGSLANLVNFLISPV